MQNRLFLKGAGGKPFTHTYTPNKNNHKIPLSKVILQILQFSGVGILKEGQMNSGFI